MFTSLPRPPHPDAATDETMTEYRLKIDFLKEVLDRLPVEGDDMLDEDVDESLDVRRETTRLPLPHGAAITRYFYG